MSQLVTTWNLVDRQIQKHIQWETERERERVIPEGHWRLRLRTAVHPFSCEHSTALGRTSAPPLPVKVHHYKREVSSRGRSSKPIFRTSPAFHFPPFIDFLKTHSACSQLAWFQGAVFNVLYWFNRTHLYLGRNFCYSAFIDLLIINAGYKTWRDLL